MLAVDQRKSPVEQTCYFIIRKHTLWHVSDTEFDGGIYWCDEESATFAKMGKYFFPKHGRRPVRVCCPEDRNVANPITKDDPAVTIPIKVRGCECPLGSMSA